MSFIAPTIGEVATAPSNELNIEPSFEEQFQATYLDSYFRTPVGAGFRAITLQMDKWNEDSPMLTKEEAAEKYPDNSFVGDIRDSAAHEIDRRRKERNRFNKIIQSGDNSFFEEAALFVGGRLIPEALDPVNAALSIGIGSGINKAIARGILSPSIAKSLTTQAGRVGRNIVEGVAGNTVAELGIVYPAALQEQQDVSIYNSMANAIIGGLAFPLATGTVGLGAKRIASFMDNAFGTKLASKADAHAKFADLVEDSLLKDKVPDVEPVIKQYEHKVLLGQKKKQLIDIDKSLEANPNNAQALEQKILLEEQINSIESTKISPDAEARMDYNAEDKGLYYNHEEALKYQEVTQNGVPENIDVFNESRDINLDNLGRMQQEGTLDAEFIPDMETAKALKVQAEKSDELLRQLTHCINRS